MTAETKQNAFEPFFSTKDHRGTGLGLAMVSRIIRLHGGETEVESKPGQGSIFRLCLPLDHPHKESH
jgi:signal transduction histidine kinase